MALGGASCKRSEKPQVAVAAASASAAPSASAGPAADVPRCRPATGAKGFALAGSGRAPALTDDEDDDQPFSPEMGSAVPFQKGFGAGALEPSASGMKAIVVLLGDGEPRRVDLGAVHGDVGPPALSAQKDSLLVAVMDGAPSGSLARFARVDMTGPEPRVNWGSEVPQGHDDSDVVSFELGEAGGVFVWDDTQDRRSVVRGVTLAAGDVKKVSAPRTLSASGEDAESPILAPRQGGFWLGFISSLRADKAQHAEDPNQAAELVESGPRFVTVVPLDPAGQLAGSPMAVTSRAGRVLGFDLAEGARGGALVAIREEGGPRNPGGGALRVVYVRPDGTTDTVPLDEEDTGSMAPVFLSDRLPTGERRLWLALATDSEGARLVPVDEQGHPLGGFSTETALGVGVPLAMSGGMLLAARPRGTGAVLETFQCDPGLPGAGKESFHP